MEKQENIHTLSGVTNVSREIQKVVEMGIKIPPGKKPANFLQWKSMLIPEHNMTKALINILNASYPEKKIPFYIMTTVALWSSPFAYSCEELVLQGFFCLWWLICLSGRWEFALDFCRSWVKIQNKQWQTAIWICTNLLKKTLTKYKRQGN